MKPFQLKIAGGILLAALSYIALDYFGLAPGRQVAKSVTPIAVELATEAPVELAKLDVSAIPLPTSAPAKIGGPLVQMNTWAWNAHMGAFFANGGPTTTTGSLYEKQGLRLKVIRQNDTEVSKAAQVKFAERVAGGEDNPIDDTVTHFVTIMGDGAAQYLASINKQLNRLGPKGCEANDSCEYRAEIVGAFGYSRGEDAFIGPPEWRDTPESARGGVVIGVLRDGDWNIAQDWIRKNGLKNNPDETTYDPTALNWIATNDYLKAVEMLVAGTCESRPIAIDGKKTGETNGNVCGQAVVTWTPGDVTVAKKKPGLIPLLSTRENPYQMPCVIIGIHRWNMTHAKQVKALLAGAFSGADQVRSYPAALNRAAQASYAIYDEESPAYWAKYYKGTKERGVALGGSSVANLGDNLVLFGLAEGSGGVSNSLFKATYEGFGNVVKAQYPELMAKFPRTESAVNLSFLESLAAELAPSKPEPVEEFAATGPIEDLNVVAKRNWTITFDTGKATFTPSSLQTLDDLYSQLVISNLAIDVIGHTDNTGNPVLNQGLSEARAFAVKSYLESKNQVAFPLNRVSAKGLGDSSPVAPNSTESGRAQNRRVTIILGTK